MTLRAKWHRLGVVLANPRYIPFMIQRRVKSPQLRDRIGGIVARLRPAKTFSRQLDRDAFDCLNEQGISRLGRLLSREQVDEICAFFKVRTVADPYRRHAPRFLPLADERLPRTHVAFHAPTDVVTAPHLLALANQPELLAIVEEFLGCRPTIGYLAAWWSYATGDAPEATELFHRDVDDWKFLKLFVYLTDVGESQGPHVYVRTSAKSLGNFDRIRRFSDAEVRRAFSDELIASVTGPAGEAFVENTYGLHKGVSVESGYRLVFQVVYSLMPLPYAPPCPVETYATLEAEKNVCLDRYVNRLYLK